MLQVKSQSRERERVGTPEEGGGKGGGVHNNFTVTEAASKGAEVF